MTVSNIASFTYWLGNSTKIRKESVVDPISLVMRKVNTSMPTWHMFLKLH